MTQLMNSDDENDELRDCSNIRLFIKFDVVLWDFVICIAFQMHTFNRKLHTQTDTHTSPEMNVDG